MPPTPPSARNRMKPLSCAEPRGEAPAPTDGGVVIAAIRRRTSAAAAGLAVGDRILAVNGTPLRDAIDFQFHAGDEHLELTVARAGVLQMLDLDTRVRV